MTRLIPILWLVSFAAAMMPLAAHEPALVMIGITMLALTVAFQILKADLPQHIAPTNGVFWMLILGFWLVAAASTCFSQIQTVSLIYFGVFSLFPLSFCCSILARNKAQFFAAVLTGLGIIFAALSAWCFVQIFAAPEQMLYGRTHWPFADPNTLGGFLSLGFFGALGVMLAAKSRAARNAGLCIAILIIGALLTTGSRGALGGVIAGLAVFGVLGFAALKGHKRCGIGLLAGFAIITILLHLFAPPPPVDMEATGSFNAVERVAETLTGEERVLWGRTAMWQSTWEIIKAHLWTGTGIGTFFLYYPEVRQAGDNISAGRMAHSDPLQFWAEMGIAAPVLFYGFIVLAFMMTMRALRGLPKDDARRVHILAPFCGLGAMILHAHITFHFYVPSMLMLAGVTLGYWYWQVREAAGAATQKMPGEDDVKFVTVTSLLLMLFCFLMIQSSYVMFERGDQAGQRGDMETFSRDVNAAGRMAQGRNAEALVIAAQVKLAGLEAQGGILRVGGRELYGDAVKFLERAERLNPRMATIPHTRARLGHAAALLGLPEPFDQEAQYKEALRLNPLYYPARMDLAKFYQRKKRPKDMLETLKGGMAWTQAAVVPDGYYEMLASVALEQKDSKTRDYALQMIEESRVIKPGIPEKSY